MNKEKFKEFFYVVFGVFSLQAFSHLMVHVFSFVPLVFGVVVHGHDHLVESVTASLILNFILHIAMAFMVVGYQKSINLNNSLRNNHIHIH